VKVEGKEKEVEGVGKSLKEFEGVRRS